MYSPILGQSLAVDALFFKLRKKVVAEIRFRKELLKAKGALDMILSSVALVATTAV
jgi:U3 small nucleolar RNA-associated protein 15